MRLTLYIINSPSTMRFKYFCTGIFLMEEEWAILTKYWICIIWITANNFNLGFNSFRRNYLRWVWNLEKYWIINTRDKKNREHSKNSINRNLCICDPLWSFICLLDLLYLKLLNELSEKVESKQDSHKESKAPVSFPPTKYTLKRSYLALLTCSNVMSWH